MNDTIELPEPYQKGVENLTDGLVTIYEPVLKNAKRQIHTLIKKQEDVCREIHEENIKICEAQCNPEFQEMFNNIKIYREKLALVKQKMVFLHETTHRLKTRVLKLEQRKQNEARYRQQQREKEEQMIGKLPST